MSASQLPSQIAHDGSTLSVFAIFVVSVILIALWGAADTDTPRRFFISGRGLGSARNGIALFGDFISAATLLGTPGLIALAGFDGIPYLVGPIVVWAVILLLIAEPFHNTGSYTVADALARRLRPRPVHLAMGLATLVISLFYLTAQLVGAGALAAPLLGISGEAAQNFLMVFLGILMIIYVAISGMHGATLVQVVKAAFLLVASIFLALLVLAKFGWNPSDLLGAAAHRSGVAEKFLGPGARSEGTGIERLDRMSLQLGALFGAAALPHLLMRMCVVPSARAARRSVQWTAVLTCVFCVTAGILGFGAAAVLGPQAIVAGSPSGNTATLLLAHSLGGSWMLTVMACVAFATILAVVAGIALAAATSVAHDLYGAVIRRGRATEEQELLVARWAVVGIGSAATGLSLIAGHINISFAAGLAFAVAASAILPALLYGLYWRGFTTTGALWSIYGGLLSSVVLAALSPGVSGSPTALFPDMDFSLFPLQYPTLVSAPVGFLLGWLGSVMGKGKTNPATYSALELRTFTGVDGQSAPQGHVPTSSPVFPGPTGRSRHR
ncbi:solute symporter family protein [Streptomyces sp. 8N706]|uniref:solute symporter family protein n=1 Tax=Streptomyces sp. 8N706 TaxID=3457416 RepID=UPI003FD0CFD2